MGTNIVSKIIDPAGRHFVYATISSSPKYKYIMVEDYIVQIRHCPMASINEDFYSFRHNGMLIISKGYRWDGASGPTIDTKNTMRASCVHDVFYQMLRERKIASRWKELADRTLQRIMKEDWHPKTWFGRQWNKIRAGYFYYAVHYFGASSCKPK